MGIEAEVLPQFFGDSNDFQPCFKPSETPHVFINSHERREEEYGVGLITEIADHVPDVKFHIYGVKFPSNQENVIYHGKVSEEQFNEEIKNYHAGLRLNKFDGNSDVVMKSVLLGQYPITYLQYPHIDCCETTETTKPLIRLLKGLKEKKVANPASEYWRQRLNDNKNVLLQEEQNQI